MIAQVRKARPTITLNGQDYYEALAPYFLTMEYTDNCDGEKADDLAIDLADRDKRFISDWMPDKGAFLDVAIVAEHWFALNAPALSLDCGRFWIDSVDFQLPDNTCSIKASSIPTNTHIKTTNETRGWEGSTLRELAEQIAGENKMTVDYQSQTNPRYARIEQNDESGLAFLKARAKDAKLAIKVHRNSVVIFDEETYEAAAAQFSIVYGSARSLGLASYKMVGGSFSTKLTDTVTKSKVTHSRIESGQLHKAEWTPQQTEDAEDAESERLLQTPDSVDLPPDSDDSGDAPELRDAVPVNNWNAPESASGQLKAKAAARDRNKDKWTGSIELALGNPLIAAGMTFNLVGLGKYDGKWFVTSASHKVGPMFTTTLGVRRCLVGY